MQSQPVHCPKCDNPMGNRVVDDKGRGVYLDDGKFNVLVGYTYCHTCGYKFFWDGEREGASVGVKLQRKQERIAGAW